MKDYVNINRHKFRRRTAYIVSKSVFFESEISVKIYDDKIILTKITDCFNGKIIKPSKRTSNWYQIAVVSDFPAGKYDLDIYESEEDTRIIFLTQNSK